MSQASPLIERVRELPTPAEKVAYGKGLIDAFANIEEDVRQVVADDDSLEDYFASAGTAIEAIKAVISLVEMLSGAGSSAN